MNNNYYSSKKVSNFFWDQVTSLAPLQVHPKRLLKEFTLEEFDSLVISPQMSGPRKWVNTQNIIEHTWSRLLTQV